mgnify:CR=1 FL=1
MLLEKIKTPGLAHLSYLIGSGGQAAVIDPRRDCDIYLEMARRQGLEITHIFETHCHEDLVSGAPILAELTGARVLHGPQPQLVAYAETTREKETFKIGQLQIEVLETPGHTDDHLAFALFDSHYPEKSVGVFTGDALFIGDVGRTDFYPDRAEEVAGLLYDSLTKILTLGDQAIVYPAHGAGSVCGAGMAEREFSTLGHERLNNPRLQITDREEFIRFKLEERHYQPPYFKLMEHLNSQGARPCPSSLRPRNLSLQQVKDSAADVLIDVREPMAYASGHLPGSINLPVSMMTAFAGWFINEKDSLVLLATDQNQLETARRHLMRIGLDNVLGGYTGMVATAAKGESLSQIPMIATKEVAQRLGEPDVDWCLLDVRSADERDETAIEGSEHIYVGHLNQGWKQLDKNRRYTLMCASGMRATVAAAWLASKGFDKVDIYLGSMGAWKAEPG